MCTKLPNWGPEYMLQVGDEGFVTLETYIAGESFYDRKSDSYQTVRFSNVYLKEFVKDNKQPAQIIL